MPPAHYAPRDRKVPGAPVHSMPLPMRSGPLVFLLSICDNKVMEELQPQKNSHALTVTLIVLIIVALGLTYFFYTKSKSQNDTQVSPTPTAEGVTGFFGKVVEVTASTLTLNGIYRGFNSESPEDSDSVHTITFDVDKSAELKSIVIHMPTKPSGSFNIEDLPRDESVGSLESLGVLINTQKVLAEVTFTKFKNSSNTPVVETLQYSYLLRPNYGSKNE